MTFSADVSANFGAATTLFGYPMRMRYFTGSAGSGSLYDDDITLATSGADVWCTGIINAISATTGRRWQNSADAQLIEQGIVIMGDQKIYLNGSIQTTGLWRVGVGSPIINEFAFIGEGTVDNEINNLVPFKTVYVRALPTGSLMGE